jgi:hypothetical protein
MMSDYYSVFHSIGKDPDANDLLRVIKLIERPSQALHLAHYRVQLRKDQDVLSAFCARVEKLAKLFTIDQVGALSDRLGHKDTTPVERNMFEVLEAVRKSEKKPS